MLILLIAPYYSHNYSSDSNNTRNISGEIVEEEETTPTGPFRYSREEMVALREAQDKILPGVPKFDCIMDRPILKAEPTRPRLVMGDCVGFNVASP